MKKSRNILLKSIKETLEKGDQWMPEVIIEGTRSSVMVKVADWPEEHLDRCKLFLGLGSTFAEGHKVHGYPNKVTFSTEAWLGKSDSPLPPSEQEDHTEVIIINEWLIGDAAQRYADTKDEKQKAESQRKVSKMRAYEIVRTKSGKYKELKPWEGGKALEAETPFLGFFLAGFQMKLFGTELPQVLKDYLYQPN